MGRYSYICRPAYHEIRNVKKRASEIENKDQSSLMFNWARQGVFSSPQTSGAGSVTMHEVQCSKAQNDPTPICLPDCKPPFSSPPEVCPHSTIRTPQRLAFNQRWYHKLRRVKLTVSRSIYQIPFERHCAVRHFPPMHSGGSRAAFSGFHKTSSVQRAPVELIGRHYRTIKNGRAPGMLAL